MKFPSLLLALSIACAAVFTLFVARPIAADWPVLLKVASIVLLMLLGFRIHWALGTALAFSAVGDWLLGVRRIGSLAEPSLFLFGLGAFLIAQLFYMGLFQKYRTLSGFLRSPARIAAAVAILLAMGGVLILLFPNLGPLLVPVIVYAAVLCSMGISAQMAGLNNSYAAIGALLFIASDASIAIAKFHGAFPGDRRFIWITYYLAQWLILRGFQTNADSNRQLVRDETKYPNITSL